MTNLPNKITDVLNRNGVSVSSALQGASASEFICSLEHDGVTHDLILITLYNAHYVVAGGFEESKNFPDALWDKINKEFETV